MELKISTFDDQCVLVRFHSFLFIKVLPNSCFLYIYVCMNVCMYVEYKDLLRQFLSIGTHMTGFIVFGYLELQILGFILWFFVELLEMMD